MASSKLKRPPLPILDELEEMAVPVDTKEGPKFIILYRENEPLTVLCPFLLWTPETVRSTLGDDISRKATADELNCHENRLALHKSGDQEVRVFGIFDSTGMSVSKHWGVVQQELNGLYMFLLQWSDECPATCYEVLVRSLKPVICGGKFLPRGIEDAQ